MNKLEEVLDDFYSCLSIPIHFINKDFKIIYEKGHDSDTDKVISNTSLYKDIKENTLSIINLAYFKDIHFIVVPLLNESTYKGYFIIGPFKSKHICNEIDIPFKPFYCIDSISYVLKNIINIKLSTGNKLSTYVKNTIDYINKNYDKDIKIDDICDFLNINKSYFCTIFKKETGYTYTNFLNKVRIEKSKELLNHSDLSIMDVALSVGFNNHNYYTTTFKKFYDKTPLEYRKLNFDECI